MIEQSRIRRANAVSRLAKLAEVRVARSAQYKSRRSCGKEGQMLVAKMRKYLLPSKKKERPRPPHTETPRCRLASSLCALARNTMLCEYMFSPFEDDEQFECSFTLPVGCSSEFEVESAFDMLELCNVKRHPPPDEAHQDDDEECYSEGCISNDRPPSASEEDESCVSWAESAHATGQRGTAS